MVIGRLIVMATLPSVGDVASAHAQQVIPATGEAEARDHGNVSDSETALARELQQRGLRAARAERWVEARDAFARAYDLIGRPLVLLNLAGAEVQIGHLVAGAEAYRRFLRETAATEVDGGVGDEGSTNALARYRAHATAQLSALAPRVPRVRIRVEGLEQGDALALDGDALSVSVVDSALPVDPGDHIATLRRSGDILTEAGFSLRERETRDVLLIASATDQAAAAPSLLESWWPWVVGAAVTVVAVGIVVLVSSGGSEDPLRGNFPPGRVVVP